jgi:hypothetical protein
MIALIILAIVRTSDAANYGLLPSDFTNIWYESMILLKLAIFPDYRAFLTSA